MDIPLIEQAKIQAQVLVPLVKALQAELGEERANALVRKTLGDVYRRFGEQWWRAKKSAHVGENMAAAFAAFAKGDAIDTACARNRRIPSRSMSRGAGTRSSTRSWASRSWDSCWCAAWTSRSPRASAPTSKLTRTQTIMQGASHCNFRYRRR